VLTDLSPIELIQPRLELTLILGLGIYLDANGVSPGFGFVTEPEIRAGLDLSLLLSTTCSRGNTPRYFDNSTRSFSLLFTHLLSNSTRDTHKRKSTTQ
jgi:hypothetical protein